MCMETSIGKLVSEMLSSEKQGGLPHAMLDVLRVLVIDKGVSWRSELIQDLVLLYAFRGDPEAVDEGELDEALRELGKKELVRVEERVKGTMGAQGSTKDKLISLVNYVAIQNALSRDRTLISYVSQRAMIAK
ncbi:MAG: hypothetical protein OEX16_02650 [Hadesarchaea archaeon]|nr:hypothetical protein [Hadesarchaea archaeon]